MRYENMSGGYGMRSDYMEIEEERRACPQCRKPVLRENSGESGDWELPRPCPHLRFVCQGDDGDLKMEYFGEWDIRAFEGQLVKRLGWERISSKSIPNGRRTPRRRSILKDPVAAGHKRDEMGYPHPGPDEEGRWPGEAKRYRKAFAGWRCDDVNLVRRADPHGGCCVGFPVPFVLLGFMIDPRKSYSVDWNESTEKHAIRMGGKPLKTPGGVPVEHANQHLLQSAARDLANGKGRDPSRLSLPSMLFTQAEFLDRGVDIVGEDFKRTLLNDVVLRTCAGPEEEYQLGRLDFLVQYLKELGLEHPRLPQTLSPEAVEQWLAGNGRKEEFDRFVSVLAGKYAELGNDRKCVVVNAFSVHGSALLGMLLALGRSDETRYANALNAANCIVGGVWGGVSREDEMCVYRRLAADAAILRSYVRDPYLLA